MRLIGQDIIDRFQRRYPQSRKSLGAWAAIIRGTDFGHHADLKRAFNSADYAAPNTIFDISGNKYRLIARVDYSLKLVLVKDVLTHEEYDRWNKK